MKVIKFNLNDLLKKKTTFSYYLLGRSYDLEENDVLQDYNKAFEIIKECADKGHVAAIYDLGANGRGADVNYELADYYLNLAKEN